MCDNCEGECVVSDSDNNLNPAQQEVIEHLGALPKDRPSFGSDLKQHLRRALETAVAHCMEEIPKDESIFLLRWVQIIVRIGHNTFSLTIVTHTWDTGKV